MRILIYCIGILMFISCKTSTTSTIPENQNTSVSSVDTSKPIEDEETEIIMKPDIAVPVEEDFTSLKFNVAIGISPSKPDWVLYSNGTYIIFPSGYSDAQMQTGAGDLLDSYSNQKVSINKSQFAKGWIGNTSKGIYTFVSQEALGEGIHSQETINAAAVSNIMADKHERKVVHINRKKN